MTTNTMTSLPIAASSIISSPQYGLMNGADEAQEPQDEGDDRSSSLSEIGERAGHEGIEGISHDVSDANDTEAETERLEDSPQRQQKNQNVVLTSANGIHDDRQSPLIVPPLPTLPANIDPHSEVDRMEQTSEISSLADSGEGNGKALSLSPSSPRKRKRSSLEQDGTSDQDLLDKSSTKGTKLFRNISAGTLVETASPSESADEEEQELIVNPTTLPEIRSQKSPQNTPPKQKYKKGKRKGRKVRNDESAIVDETHGTDSPTRDEEYHEVLYSNEEEIENGGVGDIAEADNGVKTEEGAIQKKTALDTLNAMEKCFATLRDKLFDERLAQCNEELAMLESPIPTHPELLAQKNVIDQRRNQKLAYEHNLKKHKLQTLQRESVANKAQALSQYMQTVRDVRDSHLEQLNKKFYQLQRERRSVDSDVPDYMFSFSTKRSQQIKQQTAYNAEVSVLAGVARYVGFPAAPDIIKARPKEVEDDLRSMGISTQISQTSQSHPPVLRAMSTASSFPRQRSGAEEHFLEQNPWANPQHPSHQQQRQQMHRQVSALSRAATPSSTPAAQRRVVDLTDLQGSASTIPDHPSGPDSSMAATSSTGEAARFAQSSHNRTSDQQVVDSTPSRSKGGQIEAIPANLALFETMASKGKAPQWSRLDRTHSPSLQRNPSQDSQTPSALPKPLPFIHTGGSSSTPGPRTSTPGRYTVVKAEDTSRISPMPQYHTQPVGTVANGQMNRFPA